MAKKPSGTSRGFTVFQLKITLLDIRPPIWRRIQVLEGTLDKLHERIQTAMGWMNSHLHQFEIDGVRYGNPELLEDDFGELGESKNSRVTPLSRLLARKKSGFCFLYEYDFGDGWVHEILLEDRFAYDRQIKYPVCLDGSRACPPEDVGGRRGYEHLLEVLADPKHEEYEELREWAGEFDPDSFTAAEATHRMQEGLPVWRSEEAW